MGGDHDLWNLESFLDSLIVELDKAQDTLSVKGVTRPLTYTVQDIALDMHIFPHFDAGKLRFAAARPGDTGASRISIQLGSITDRQIREVSRQPPTADDVVIDVLPDVDDDTKQALRAVGVTSARDLERLEDRDVDVGQMVADKGGAGFANLSDVLNKARRARRPPLVSRATAIERDGRAELILQGEYLASGDDADGYPVALIEGRPVEVVEADDRHLRLVLPSAALRRGPHHVAVALDRYADFRCTVAFDRSEP